MPQGLTGVHALIILAVIILLFGAAKLPGLAKSVGQSMKIFKNEIKSDKPDETQQAAPAAVPTQAPPGYGAQQAAPQPVAPPENTTKP